jgi:hypothetical protein
MSLLQRQLAAAAAAAASLGIAAPAAGAAPASPLAAAITAPAAGALVSAKQVPVRLRVGPKVTRIRVFAGTTELTNRFTRRGRVWGATLPRTVLGRGTNRLLVQAYEGSRAGGTDARSFTVVRPAPKLMTVRTGASAPAGGLLAAKPAVSVAGSIPVTVTTRTPTIARLTVNGHRVADLRAERALKSHSWLVSARDGLRTGANAFRIDSYAGDGRHAVKRWTVRRGARLPLAEAGPHERVVNSGRWLRLNASASRATQKGAKLSYRWQVVSAPKGAKPVLSAASSAKPRFKPDVPGVYQLALRATHVRPGAASAASAGSSAQDLVTVDAAPAIGKQGLFVDTSLQGDPAYGRNHIPWDTMYLDDQPYPSFTDGAPDEFVQLDESTLAVVASGTHADVAPADGTITIGVWQGTTVPYSADQYGSEIWFGTKVVARNVSPNAPAPGTGNPTTNLHGWIQPASGSADATWVDSDMLTLATRAQGSTPTTNTMDVGGTAYTSSLPAGATGGFQLLILDNAGQPTADPTVYPITGDPDETQANEDLLAAKLDQAAKNEVTILVQGFGDVGSIASGSKLSNALGAIGARTDVLQMLNGSSDPQGAAYSLVAGLDAQSNVSDWKAKETSFERTKTGGSFTGLLVRDPQADDYIPLIGDPAKPDALGASRYATLPFLYSAPTSWSDSVRDNGALRAATPGEQAAMRYIAAYAGKQNDWTADECGDPRADAIRAYYCHLGDSDLSDLSNDVAGITYDASDGSANGYSATDFATAQHTYEGEITDVKSVHDGIANYQTIFGADGVDAIVDADTIAQKIQAQLYSATQPVTDNTYDVMEGALTVLSGVPDVGTPAAYLAGLFAMGSAILPDTSGDPSLPNQVELTQANAAANLTQYYKAASNQLGTFGDYIVEDPAKLMQLAAMFKTGPLALTASSKVDLENVAEFGTQQFLWGTLLGTTYAEWTAPTATLPLNPTCDYGGAAYTPFSNVADSGHWQWQAPNQPAGIDHWWMGVNYTSTPDRWMMRPNAGLPRTITDPLFTAVNASRAPSQQTAIGAVMPYFALTYLPFKSVDILSNPEKQTFGCFNGG